MKTKIVLLVDPGWTIIEAQVSSTDAGSRSSTLGELEAALRADGVRGNDFTYAFETALAFDHLGEGEKALDWLERAEAAGTHSFNMIEADPRLDDLKNEPRFKKLVEKLHRSQ